MIGAIVAGYFLGFPLCDKFIFIANQRPDGLYEKSLWDITFLFFYICVFTSLRAATMQHVLIPLAKYAEVNRKKYQRFAEQGWAFIYYTISFTCGTVSGSWSRNLIVWASGSANWYTSILCIIPLGGTTPATFGAIIPWPVTTRSSSTIIWCSLRFGFSRSLCFRSKHLARITGNSSYITSTPCCLFRWATDVILLELEMQSSSTWICPMRFWR